MNICLFVCFVSSYLIQQTFEDIHFYKPKATEEETSVKDVVGLYHCEKIEYVENKSDILPGIAKREKPKHSCVQVVHFKIATSNKVKCTERDMLIHYTGIDSSGNLAKMHGYLNDDLGQIKSAAGPPSLCRRIRKIKLNDNDIIVIVDDIMMFAEIKDMDKCILLQFWKEWSTFFDYICYRFGWYNVKNDFIYIPQIIKDLLSIVAIFFCSYCYQKKRENTFRKTAKKAKLLETNMAFLLMKGEKPKSEQEVVVEESEVVDDDDDEVDDDSKTLAIYVSSQFFY